MLILLLNFLKDELAIERRELYGPSSQPKQDDYDFIN
jgi:hypothetical protein